MARTPATPPPPPVPTGPACLKALPSGCELLVQVVPNASRTQVAGLHDGALRVRLMAPPIEGRATRRLVQGWPTNWACRADRFSWWPAAPVAASGCTWMPMRPRWAAGCSSRTSATPTSSRWSDQAERARGRPRGSGHRGERSSARRCGLPNSAQRSSDQPRSRPYSSAARNASPQPVGSTTRWPGTPGARAPALHPHVAALVGQRHHHAVDVGAARSSSDSPVRSAQHAGFVVVHGDPARQASVPVLGTVEHAAALSPGRR